MSAPFQSLACDGYFFFESSQPFIFGSFLHSSAVGFAPSFSLAMCLPANAPAVETANSAATIKVVVVFNRASRI